MKNIPKKILLWYLRVAVKIQLKKSRPVIVGIAGGAGKTSVCKLLSVVLRKNFKVKASGGLNTESGVPLSILNLPPKDYSFFDWMRIAILIPWRLLTQWRKYDFCIVEMAIERPKDMEYLLRIVKPKIATITNITLEHSENFDSLVKDNENHEEKILGLIEKEEGLLIKGLSPDKIAVLNVDDKRIAKLKEETKAKMITVSVKDESADIFVKNVKADQDHLKLEIANDKKTHRLNLKPLSSAYIHTILITIGLAKACKINIKEAIETIEEKFTLPPGRLSVFKGIKGTTIIDSSYNAQPIAVIDSLDFLKNIGEEKRKIAVLGDMRELGKEAEKSHKEMAEKIKETVDFTILIGPLMKKYVAPILEKSGNDYKSFDNFTNAKEFIKNEVKNGDIILVKGSQNTILLERVVEMLLLNKKDKKKLCRQRPFWDKKRKETP